MSVIQRFSRLIHPLDPALPGTKWRRIWRSESNGPIHYPQNVRKNGLDSLIPPIGGGAPLNQPLPPGVGRGNPLLASDPFLGCFPG